MYLLIKLIQKKKKRETPIDEKDGVFVYGTRYQHQKPRKQTWHSNVDYA